MRKCSSIIMHNCFSYLHRRAFGLVHCCANINASISISLSSLYRLCYHITNVSISWAIIFFRDAFHLSDSFSVLEYKCGIHCFPICRRCRVLLVFFPFQMNFDEEMNTLRRCYCPVDLPWAYRVIFQCENVAFAERCLSLSPTLCHRRHHLARAHPRPRQDTRYIVNFM